MRIGRHAGPITRRNIVVEVSKMSQKNRLKKLLMKKGIDNITVGGTIVPVQAAKELDLIEEAQKQGIM